MTSLLSAPQLCALVTHIPGAFTGPTLHRWALRALHERAYEAADRLFEQAAERYRKELAVEPLARLRVQQLIARVRATDDAAREAELSIEVERRLTRLERIEALEPPFGLVPASSLLATWLQSERRETAPSEDVRRAA